MTDTGDFILEIARLKDRVAALEKSAFSAPGEFVEGWTRAGKVVGITAKTCQNRLRDGEFPSPCRIDVLPRTAGPSHERPVWRHADLVAYAEGRWEAK